MAARERIGWIDWVRALGACAIVLLHCLVSTRLAVDVGVDRGFVYLLVDIIGCRWAVPAFFMISGVLLLDPAKSLEWADVGRYVGRMVLVLATYGFVFAGMEEAYTALSAGTGLGLALLGQAAIDVVTLRTWDHLWYVYALVGVYALAPALRMVWARLGKRGFSLLTAFLFVAVLVVPLFAGITPPNTLIGVACFCVGGCLRDWRLSPAVVCVGIASVVYMVGTGVVGYEAGNVRSELFLQGSGFACAYAVMVVLGIRRLSGDAPLPEGGPVAHLARDSFGIYLIHPLFIHVALMLVDPLSCAPGIFELTLFAAVLAASTASTRLLRRIPLLAHMI